MAVDLQLRVRPVSRSVRAGAKAGAWFAALAACVAFGCGSESDDVTGQLDADADTPSDTGDRGDSGGPPSGGGAGGASACGEAPCGERELCDESGAAPTCRCAPGFSGQRCDDVAECLAPGVCGAHGLCLERFGGFSCSCEPGYERQGDACVDVDECSLGALCANGASCTNHDGGYACSCPLGQIGDGKFCKPSAACGPSSCGGHGSCLETPSGSVCRCESGYGGPACATSCAEISFGDAGLEALVRGLVGKPTGPLSPVDLAGRTTLSATNLDLTSLQGLECWPGLTSLNVAGNLVDGEALGVMRHLTELTHLVLDCNPVDDLSALAEHPSLRELSFASTGADCPTPAPPLDPLGEALWLEWLDLSSQGYDDLAALGPLVGLRSLGLAQNPIDEADLAALGPRPLLAGLYLAGTELSELSGVADFAQLRELDVSGNAVGQLGPLAATVKLEVLSASGCGLAQLEGLAPLVRLRRLDVSWNDVVDLGPLSELVELGELYLNENRIESLQPLVDERRRGVVYFYDNPLGCDPKLWKKESKIAQQLVDQGVDLVPWPDASAGCSAP